MKFRRKVGPRFRVDTSDLVRYPTLLPIRTCSGDMLWLTWVEVRLRHGGLVAPLCFRARPRQPGLPIFLFPFAAQVLTRIASDPLRFLIVSFYAAALLLLMSWVVGVAALLAGAPSLFPLKLPPSLVGFVELYFVCLLGHALYIRLLVGRCQHMMADDLFWSRGTWESQEILREVGHEQLMRLSRPEVLDKDTDGGGMPRRLLRLHIPHDEPLTCVEVKCPSTGETHFLRVPPTIQTAHDGVAWSFRRNRRDYGPGMET